MTGYQTNRKDTAKSGREGDSINALRSKKP
jgi:hypothetical protein